MKNKRAVKPECDLFSNGHCKKYDGRCSCEPSGLNWFEEDDTMLSVIEPDEMCRKEAIFGNNFLFIKKEQLDALQQGKVLFIGGEYGTFIALELSEKTEGGDE